jgi:hypothetical protein
VVILTFIDSKHSTTDVSLLHGETSANTLPLGAVGSRLWCLLGCFYKGGELVA